ncbi:hypothetical protein P7C73_g5836, partial [Tremellales sp. Uapishka_1]
MPSELLHFPPSYTIVGIYRLLTDPLIRGPVLDKIKHASLRGAVVALIYAGGSWRILDWFVRTFLVGGGSFFGIGGLGGKRVGEAVKDSVGGVIQIGLGSYSFNVDLVLCQSSLGTTEYITPDTSPDTHLLILLPQVSSILRFFILKNLRLARSRAYALTVASRGKPAEFWSQGYIEEWASPPSGGPQSSLEKSSRKDDRRSRQETWISWVLWWPTQLVLRHYILLPLSPTLPLLVPLFTSTLKSLTTASYLHEPYFAVKRMSSVEVDRWIEERVWAYRVFGFAASILESIPIVGLFLSISNRIGAAMWAFDLEKRQHLFSAGLLQPLPRGQEGIWGMGDLVSETTDIQELEKEEEKTWAESGKQPDAL